MRPKKIIAVLLLACLLMPGMALGEGGIDRFAARFWDGVLSDEARALVRTGYDGSDTIMLGDVRATLREVLTDGICAFAAVVFESPEGTLMAVGDGGPWDDFAPSEYTARYFVSDGGIYRLEDDTFVNPEKGMEQGFDYLRVSMNELLVVYMFAASDFLGAETAVRVGVAPDPGEGRERAYERAFIMLPMDVPEGVQKEAAIDVDGLHVRVAATPLMIAFAVEGGEAISDDEEYVLQDANGETLPWSRHSWTTWGWCDFMNDPQVIYASAAEPAPVDLETLTVALTKRD